MPFEIVGDITQVETIKGVALVRLRSGALRRAELHWYEARSFVDRLGFSPRNLGMQPMTFGRG